jgi:hypothetical protein
MNNKNIKLSFTAFLIAFFLAFFLTSCKSDHSKKIKSENLKSTMERISNSNTLPEIEFDKSNHDFKEISEGDIVETAFIFTNVGSSDLIISSASGSCGCTVPEYPKDQPIKPGETGVIKVKFDSSNKPGLQRKTVTLTTNTLQGKQVLNIKAIVTPKSN